jgi:hypothetical protein
MVLAPLREDGAFSVRQYVLTLSVAAQTLSQASRKGKGGRISPPGGPCFNRQRSLPLNHEERGEPVLMICLQRLCWLLRISVRKKSAHDGSTSSFSWPSLNQRGGVKTVSFLILERIS